MRHIAAFLYKTKSPIAIVGLVISIIPLIKWLAKYMRRYTSVFLMICSAILTVALASLP